MTAVLTSNGTGAPSRSVEAVGSYFETLGRRVEQAWAIHRNNEESFPEVAKRVLADTPVPADADAVGVLQFLTSRHRLLKQEEYGFGEPPITLFRSRDFYISALYWLDGTTTIHQHMFSGAFRVLEGSSIHTRYGYSRQETITRRMSVGDIRFGGTELLRQGDVREIVSGDAFIHALFHLDRPSVTIVVRTNREEAAGPQFEYFAPGLAFDPFFMDETLDRQLRGLSTLHAIAPAEAFASARSMVAASDVFGGFFLTRHWAKIDRSDEQLDQLVDDVIRRHGSIATILRPVMAERRRQAGIIVRRRLLEDPAHRLFLALLLNLPDREAIDTIVRAKFPGEAPGTVLARWVEELNSPQYRGISGLRLTTDDINSVRAALAQDSQAASHDAVRLLGSKVVKTPMLDLLLG